MNTELYDAHMWSIYAELSKDPPPAGNDEPFLITAEPNEELLLGQPKVDYMFIKGSRIRYFHLPEGVDMIECIETQLASFRRRQQPTERPFNWKSYRKKQKIEQLQLKLGESEQRQEEPDTTETSSVQGVEPECSQNQAQ